VENSIRAEALTSFDVSPDGNTVRFNMRNQHGAPSSVELPAACVSQLLLTLPRVIQQSLRNIHGDDAVRLVHVLDCFRLDPGEPDADGERRHVLTLRTSGGYEAAFAMTGPELGAIIQTVVDQALSAGAVLEPVGLNS
jgi:hypothetical protein